MSSASVSTRAAAGEHPAVLALALSHDGTTLATGTSTGFVVYHIGPGTSEADDAAAGGGGGGGGTSSSSGPEHGAAKAAARGNRGSFVEVARRDVDGGVGLIAVVERWNVLAFVGAAERTRTTVTIWDDTAAASPQRTTARGVNEGVVATLTLQSAVRCLRLCRHCIVVGLESQTLLFNSALQQLAVFKAAAFGNPGAPADNNANTVALATFADTAADHEERGGAVVRLVVLGPKPGLLMCVAVPVAQEHHPEGAVGGSSTGTGTGDAAEVSAASRHSIVRRHARSIGIREVAAHSHPVSAVGINLLGTVAVSVSTRGTSLKVLSVADGRVVADLHRGNLPRLVRSIALSPDGSLAAAVSEAGTLHCYALTGDAQLVGKGMRRSPQQQQHKSRRGVAEGRDWASWALLPRRFTEYLGRLSAIATYSLADDTSSGAHDAQLRGAAPPLDSDGGGGGDGANASLLYKSEGFTAAAASRLDCDFACLAVRPEVSDSGVASVIVAQGCSLPQSVGVKSRCVRIAVKLREREQQCEKFATHLFPREEI